MRTTHQNGSTIDLYFMCYMLYNYMFYTNYDVIIGSNDGIKNNLTLICYM